MASNAMRWADAIAEAEPALAGADLVGERPSSRNDHDGTRAPRDGVEPSSKLAERTTLPPSLTTIGRAGRGGRQIGGARTVRPASSGAPLGAHDLDADRAGLLVELLDGHR